MVAALVLAPWLVWAIVRGLALEQDLDQHAYAVIAFTPWAAWTSVLPLLVALVLRRWAVAAVAAGVVLVFALVMLPRALPGPRPHVADPVRLRAVTVNVHEGGADPAAVVALVRRTGASLLTVIELTPEEAVALDRAGLRRLLPHRVLATSAGASGAGLYARAPLRPVAPYASLTSNNRMPRARLALPGRGTLDVQAMHPPDPEHSGIPPWRRALDGLPLPPGGRELPILIGDFNGTLDHKAVRRLLGDGGYVDAADAAGAGWRMTFPADRRFPALIAIDHLLVDPRIAVRGLDVVEVPGTDHRALVADLELPRTPR